MYPESVGIANADAAGPRRFQRSESILGPDWWPAHRPRRIRWSRGVDEKIRWETLGSLP